MSRVWMTRFSAVMAAIAAIVALPHLGGVASVGFITSASAQEFPEWWDNRNTWEAPRFRRPPPAYRRPQYDDGYDFPREERRVYRDRYDEDRDYDPREDDQRDDGIWRNQREERRYQRRREVDRDDQNGRDQDNAQWPAEEGDPNKIAGVDGGAQPFIPAVAPPQVRFNAGYAPGSIVIDTGARKLYYVTSSFSAYAYPIGVGREGFAWTGSEKVSRIQDWPDWYPPAEMRKRRPELPERMLGGLKNPLGAKAIYLGNTLYRIHGTNDAKSIGKAESSGCFRMLNQNVLHLASLVSIGTPVTVVSSLGGGVANASNNARLR